MHAYTQYDERVCVYNIYYTNRYVHTGKVCIMSNTLNTYARRTSMCVNNIY